MEHDPNGFKEANYIISWNKPAIKIPLVNQKNQIKWFTNSMGEMHEQGYDVDNNISLLRIYLFPHYHVPRKIIWRLQQAFNNIL